MWRGILVEASNVWGRIRSDMGETLSQSRLMCGRWSFKTYIMDKNVRKALYLKICNVVRLVKVHAQPQRVKMSFFLSLTFIVGYRQFQFNSGDQWWNIISHTFLKLLSLSLSPYQPGLSLEKSVWLLIHAISALEIPLIWPVGVKLNYLQCFHAIPS